MTHKAPSLFDWKIAGPAIGDAFKKLNPRAMVKNPVMFVTLVGAVLTTVDIFLPTPERGVIIQIAIWLWFTVLFANFAEAVAEGRGKAQAKALRNTRTQTTANKVRENGKTDANRREQPAQRRRGAGARGRNDSRRRRSD